MGNNKLRYEISLYELSPGMLTIRNGGGVLVFLFFFFFLDRLGSLNG
jgi:hypothetical protein